MCYLAPDATSNRIVRRARLTPEVGVYWVSVPAGPPPDDCVPRARGRVRRARRGCQTRPPDAATYSITCIRRATPRRPQYDSNLIDSLLRGAPDVGGAAQPLAPGAGSALGARHHSIGGPIGLLNSARCGRRARYANARLLSPGLAGGQPPLGPGARSALGELISMCRSGTAPARTWAARLAPVKRKQQTIQLELKAYSWPLGGGAGPLALASQVNSRARCWHSY